MKGFLSCWSVACLAWSVAGDGAVFGASFVQNQEELRRIEEAVPAKAIVAPRQPRRLLIFTLNVGYGGHPSMAHANEAFSLMGRKTGAFETSVSADPAVFASDSLKRFDAVFFNNTVGNCFTNQDWRQNLIEFVLGGGGLLGVHGTSVAFTRWPGAFEDWPEFGYLIGARGANHAASDEHVWMKLDDPDHPLNRLFGGQGFDYRDEFFRPQGTYSRDRVRVLLSIDTSKTDPNQGQIRGNGFRADNDYAVAWVRQYGRGRVFYSTIAHNPYVFWDPKMLQFYLGALQFALGDLPAPTTPSARLTPSVRAQEKLGWRQAFAPLKVQLPSFLDTIGQAARLQLPYVSGSGFQTVSAEGKRPFGPALTDAELGEIRLKLESSGVRLLTYELGEWPATEADGRRLFEFGRKMGVELFIGAPKPETLVWLEKLCESYRMPFAFTGSGGLGARQPADPRVALRLCAGGCPWFGVAADLSRLGVRPGRMLQTLGQRLLVLRLDEPVRATALEAGLAQVHRLGAKPVFLVCPGATEVPTSALETFNNAILTEAAKP